MSTDVPPGMREARPTLRADVERKRRAVPIPEEYRNNIQLIVIEADDRYPYLPDKFTIRVAPCGRFKDHKPQWKATDGKNTGQGTSRDEAVKHYLDGRIQSEHGEWCHNVAGRK